MQATCEITGESAETVGVWAGLLYSTAYWTQNVFLGRYFIHFMLQNGYGELLQVIGRRFSDFLRGLDNLHEYFRFRYGAVICEWRWLSELGTTNMFTVTLVFVRQVSTVRASRRQVSHCTIVRVVRATHRMCSVSWSRSARYSLRNKFSFRFDCRGSHIYPTNVSRECVGGEKRTTWLVPICHHENRLRQLRHRYRS